MKNSELPVSIDKLITETVERTTARVIEKMTIPRWMKLKMAIHYSGLSRSRLINLAKERLIIGGPDPGSKRGDWRFDKQSIDEYMMSLVVGERYKAQAIIESLKTA